jgi:hypothetical protein
MLAHTSFTWLLWEGLMPLFGASGVYLASGFYKRLASPGSTYAWGEAVDPMGWLYGALIIAVQSAVRLFEAGAPYLYAGIGCTICILACGMQLLAGMNERGADRSWRPSRQFKIAALVTIAIVLVSGYLARSTANTGSSARSSNVLGEVSHEKEI